MCEASVIVEKCVVAGDAVHQGSRLGPDAVCHADLEGQGGSGGLLW